MLSDYFRMGTTVRITDVEGDATVTRTTQTYYLRRGFWEAVKTYLPWSWDNSHHWRRCQGESVSAYKKVSPSEAA